MRTFLQTFTDRRNLLMFGMGISSGLPLALTGGALKLWLKEYGLDLATLGLLGLVGLPYTLKFLWSPVFDRFIPPFFGRRRGWMLITQIGLICSIFGISSVDPSQSVTMIAGWAIAITFFSASQDIVIDAYRWEILKPEEYGVGASTYVTGYRIATNIIGTLLLILVDKDGFLGMSWSHCYQLMSVGILIGIACTFAAKEPEMYAPPPKNVKESLVDPFLDYLARPGAILMLIFMLLYKVGDNIAAEMLWPFYKELGYSLTVIGSASKFTGLAGVVIGGFIGGAMILQIGLRSSLWICGILQAISTVSFTWLAWIGAAALAASAASQTATPPAIWALVLVIFIENVAGGMGTSAFMAFMGLLTNKKYTATQYALFTSFMGVPRVVMGSTSGWLAQQFGWPMFFVACALVAIPGLLLLVPMAHWIHEPDETKSKASAVSPT